MISLVIDISLYLHYPSLVLVQPRKTCACLTERLLMGRKESNKLTNYIFTVAFWGLPLTFPFT